MPLADKLAPAPQRRLLALDGGGVRGAATIEVLAVIEVLLRERSGRGDAFRLSQYFDYVAGTSTGAILATLISLGLTVDEIRHFYHDNGSAMFEKSRLLDRYRNKYADDRLSTTLRAVFQPPGLANPSSAAPLTLGSDALQTLLLVVMRNASTNSPWPVSNNPRAVFNDRSRDDCNLDIPLWQLVRASTAAPVYFPPEEVHIGSNRFVFVDGGVTAYNNPAMLLFLFATIPELRLGWATGVDKMLLVSVGTGASADVKANLTARDMNLLYNVTTIPSALMYAAAIEQDVLCRVFGRCVAGSPIDSELGALVQTPDEEARYPFPKLFTYARFNADLSGEGLSALGLADIDPLQVRQLDAVSAMPDLTRIGRALAKEVSAEVFVPFLPEEKKAEVGSREEQTVGNRK